MSTFDTLSQEPISKKVILVELDIAQGQDFWTNYRAGSWWVNFENSYSDIDSSLLGGVDTKDITRIGSVKVDEISLFEVSSASVVQLNELSFYYSDALKSLYIHCEDGDDPGLHLITIGEAIGISNVAGYYNNFLYEARLKSAPSISKSADPLFFGKIMFEGGNVAIDNTDGEYDQFAEDNDVYGNVARILIGFDDLEYSDFLPVFSGIVENISIGADEMIIGIQDKRKYLSIELPVNVFDDTTYPYIDESNVGASIPIGYGEMKNVPVICVNEGDTGDSVYDFKLCDTTYWSIKSIDEVRVGDTAKNILASDLDDGTFSLSDTSYEPGDDVTCDYKGYVDDAGGLIENACDIIADLMTSYASVIFNNNFYDIARWESGNVPDINYFLNEGKSLIDVIEEISSTARGYFIVRDDGRYAYRLIDKYAASLQTIEKEELFEIPVVDYDPTEILTSTIIGYEKDWANNEHLILTDKTQEEAINEKYHIYKEKFFPTLLKNSTDAQEFSNDVLDLSGEVTKIFSASMKTQAIKRSLIDVITIAINRHSKKMFGYAKAVIIGVDKNLTDSTVNLTCKVIEFLPDTIYEQSSFYDDAYYNDAYYGITQDREIE